MENHLGILWENGMRRIKEFNENLFPTPSPEFTLFIDTLSQGKFRPESPFYAVLPGGMLNMQTYGKKGGLEYGDYDVVTQNGNARLIYPVIHDLQGTFKVSQPLRVSM